jgi:hypothetical protein
MDIEGMLKRENSEDRAHAPLPIGGPLNLGGSTSQLPGVRVYGE